MNFYAYDGATWRDIQSVYAYDGASWRLATECWVYDGASWRQVCGDSCATASIDSGGASWTLESCTDANECQLCVKMNHTDCTDPCHNVDTRMSINGGSFNLVLACSNDSCTNTTGTDCTGEYDCDTQIGGAKCYSNANTHKPRLEIQRDSDSGVDATWTYGSTFSGACFAV